MALQLNPFLKSTATGIPQAMLQMLNVYVILKIFPNTVPYPGTGTALANVTTGNILTLTGAGRFAANGSGIITSTGSWVAAAAGAGTLGWWALENVGAVGSATAAFVVASDSIGLIGSSNIMTVSTMTPTAGQSVTIAFTLKAL
jgi:hypothetical protein